MMADRRHRSPERSSIRRKESRRSEFDEPQSQSRAGVRSGAESIYSSSSSSFEIIDISHSFPPNRSGLATFFTAPSERRLRRRRSGRLARHSNSSSDSVGDLAYGHGYMRRPKRKVRSRKGKEIDRERYGERERERERERYTERERYSDREKEKSGISSLKTDAEILAVGAGLAKLARDQNRLDLKSAARNGKQVFAAQEFSQRGDGPNRGLGLSKISHGSDTVDEDGWESASDVGSESSTDSRLAFGAESHGGWGIFGRKIYSPQSRKDSVVDPQLFGPANSLHGLVTEPVGFGEVYWSSTSDFGQHPFAVPKAESVATSSQPPMQTVYPIATEESTRFDAARSSVASGPEPYMSSRPGPIALQQPQPITPVSQSVYEPSYDTRSESGNGILKKTSTSSGRGKSLAEAALFGVAGAAVGAAIASERKDDRRERRRGSDRDPRDEGRAPRRRDSERKDTKDNRKRDQNSPDYDERKRRDRERIKDFPDDRKDKKWEMRRDDEFDASRAERRERRQGEKPVKRGDDEHDDRRSEPSDIRYQNRRTKSESAVSQVSVDPFQYQVDNDAFATPTNEPAIGHDRVQPVSTIITVEREPDFARKRSSSIKETPASYTSESVRRDYVDGDERDSRGRDPHGDSRDGPLHEAESIYHEAEYFTAPVDAAAISAAIAAEGYRQSRSERRRDERRGEQHSDYDNYNSKPRERGSKRDSKDYDDYNRKPHDGEFRDMSQREPERDPIQEEADRAYREIVMARKIASQVIRSRTPSPNRSIVDKYDLKEEEEEEIIRIVTPPGMDDHKKQGLYDAPNADFQLDHVLEDPREIRRFSLPPSTRDRSNSDALYLMKDPEASQPRPLLNLVLPTPSPSPMPEKQVARSEATQTFETEVEVATTAGSDVATSSKGNVAPSGTPSTASKGVTWGENETKHFEVESPSEHRDDFDSSVERSARNAPVKEAKAGSRESPVEPPKSASGSKSGGWGAIAAGIIGASAGIGAAKSNAASSSSKSSKSEETTNEEDAPYEYRGVVVESGSPPRSQRQRSPPYPGPKPSASQSSEPSHIPGAFNDDLDFTATVAAGLEDTGFDPNIVINDPRFRRRDSPPGSNGPSLHQTPYAETVSDPGSVMTNSGSTRDGRGFVVGEVGSPPGDCPTVFPNADDTLRKLRGKEDKKREKSNRQSRDHTPTEEEASKNDVVEESDSSSDTKFRKREQNMPDKEGRRQRRQSEDVTTLDERSVVTDLVEEPDSYIDEPRRRSMKSKTGSSSYDSNTEGATQDVRKVSVPVDAFDDLQNGKDDGTETKKSKRKSKRNSELYESSRFSSSDNVSQLERSSSLSKKPKTSKRTSMPDSASLEGDLVFQSAGDFSQIASTSKSNGNGTHHFDDEREWQTRDEIGRESRVGDESETSQKDSFLARAGTLGAGVGLAGAAVAIAAQRHQQSNADNAYQAERSRSRSSSRPRQLEETLDPEITQRQFRPSIDPQYGDLLPLPPSDPVSPNEEPVQDLPGLPDSRPDSPEADRLAREKGMASMRKSMHDTVSVKPPSHSAVPLKFILSNRSNPASPAAARSSPLQSPAAPPQDLLQFPRTRPRPTSWDSTKEYKTLFLVESNRRGSNAQQQEAEESLPALPPSQGTSRSSSQLDSRDDAALEDLVDPLAIDTRLTKRSIELLDSRQSTPKASVFQYLDADQSAEQMPLHASVDASDESSLHAHRPVLPEPEDDHDSSAKTAAETAAGTSLVSSIGYFASSPKQRPTDKTFLDRLPSYSRVQPPPVDPMTKDRSSYLLQSSPLSRKAEDDESNERVEESPTSRRQPSELAGDALHSIQEPDGSEYLETSGNIQPLIEQERERTLDTLSATTHDRSVLHRTEEAPTIQTNNTATIHANPEDEPADEFVRKKSKKDKKKDKKKGKSLSRSSTQDDATLPETNQEILDGPVASVEVEPAVDYSLPKSKKDRKKSRLSRSPTQAGFFKEPSTSISVDPSEEFSTREVKKDKKIDKKRGKSAVVLEPEVEQQDQKSDERIDNTANDDILEETPTQDEFTAAATKRSMKKDKKSQRSTRFREAEDQQSSSNPTEEPAQDTSRELSETIMPVGLGMAAYEEFKAFERPLPLVPHEEALEARESEATKEVNVFDFQVHDKAADAALDQSVHSLEAWKEKQAPKSAQDIVHEVSTESPQVKSVPDDSLTSTLEKSVIPVVAVGAAILAPDHTGEELEDESAPEISTLKHVESEIPRSMLPDSDMTKSVPDRLQTGYDIDQLNLARQLQEEFGSGNKKPMKDKRKRQSLPTTTDRDLPRSRAPNEASEDHHRARSLSLRPSTSVEKLGGRPMSEDRKNVYSEEQLEFARQLKAEFGGGKKKTKKDKKTRQGLSRTSTQDDLAFDQPAEQPQSMISKTIEKTTTREPTQSTRNGLEAGYQEDQLSLARQLQAEYGTGSKTWKKDRSHRSTSLTPAQDPESQTDYFGDTAELSGKEPSQDFELADAPDSSTLQKDTARNGLVVGYDRDQLELARQMKEEFSLGSKKSKKDKKKRQSLSRNTTEDDFSSDHVPKDPTESRDLDPQHESTAEPIPREPMPAEPEVKFAFTTKKSKKDKKGKKRESFVAATAADIISETVPKDLEESHNAGVQEEIMLKSIPPKPAEPEEAFTATTKKYKKDKKDKKRQNMVPAADEDEARDEPVRSDVAETAEDEDPIEAESIELTTENAEEEFGLTRRKSKKDKKGKKHDRLLRSTTDDTSSSDNFGKAVEALHSGREVPSEGPDRAPFEDDWSSAVENFEKDKEKGQSLVAQNFFWDQPTDEGDFAQSRAIDNTSTADILAVSSATEDITEPADDPGSSTKKSKKDKKKRPSLLRSSSTLDDAREQPIGDTILPQESAHQDIADSTSALTSTIGEQDDDLQLTSKKSKRDKKKRGSTQISHLPDETPRNLNEIPLATPDQSAEEPGIDLHEPVLEAAKSEAISDETTLEDMSLKQQPAAEEVPAAQLENFAFTNKKSNKHKKKRRNSSVPDFAETSEVSTPTDPDEEVPTAIVEPFLPMGNVAAAEISTPSEMLPVPRVSAIQTTQIGQASQEADVPFDFTTSELKEDKDKRDVILSAQIEKMGSSIDTFVTRQDFVAAESQPLPMEPEAGIDQATSEGPFDFVTRRSKKDKRKRKSGLSTPIEEASVPMEPENTSRKLDFDVPGTDPLPNERGVSENQMMQDHSSALPFETTNNALESITKSSNKGKNGNTAYIASSESASSPPTMPSTVPQMDMSTDEQADLDSRRLTQSPLSFEREISINESIAETNPEFTGHREMPVGTQSTVNDDFPTPLERKPLQKDKRKRQATGVNINDDPGVSHNPVTSWADEVGEAEVERKVAIIQDIANDDSLSHIASTTEAQPIDEFSRPTKKGKRAKKRNSDSKRESSLGDEASRSATMEAETPTEDRDIPILIAAAAGSALAAATFLASESEEDPHEPTRSKTTEETSAKRVVEVQPPTRKLSKKEQRKQSIDRRALRVNDVKGLTVREVTEPGAYQEWKEGNDDAGGNGSWSTPNENEGGPAEKSFHAPGVPSKGPVDIFASASTEQIPDPRRDANPENETNQPGPLRDLPRPVQQWNDLPEEYTATSSKKDKKKKKRQSRLAAWDTPQEAQESRESDASISHASAGPLKDTIKETHIFEEHKSSQHQLSTPPNDTLEDFSVEAHSSQDDQFKPRNSIRYSHQSSSSLPIVREESPVQVEPEFPELWSYTHDKDEFNRDSAFVTDSPIPGQRPSADEHIRDSGVHVRESSPFGRTVAPVSTSDSANARLSWPALDEVSETVDTHRSRRPEVDRSTIHHGEQMVAIQPAQAHALRAGDQDFHRQHKSENILDRHDEDRDSLPSQRRGEESHTDLHRTQTIRRSPLLEDERPHRHRVHRSRESDAEVSGAESRDRPPHRHEEDARQPRHRLHRSLHTLEGAEPDQHGAQDRTLPLQRYEEDRSSDLHRMQPSHPSQKPQSLARQRVHRVESPDLSRSHTGKEERIGDLGTSQQPNAETPKTIREKATGTAAAVAGATVGFAAARQASREDRPWSAHSQRSPPNINRLRTPDPKIHRPESVGSNRSTPPLRRSDRKSGDLRSLSQRTNLDLAKEAELVAITATASEASTTVPSTNPQANEGRVRAKEMADVYVCKS